MFWKCLLPQIPTEDFPKCLESQTQGTLDLQLSFLVLKDGELELVPAELLMPGNEIKARFIRYELGSDEGSRIGGALYPPGRGRVDLKAWAGAFDRRFLELSQGWRQILISQPKKLTNLLRCYGEESLNGDAFVENLELTNLKIQIASNDELVFAPASPFDSLNLNVVVSPRNKVRSVHFEG